MTSKKRTFNSLTDSEIAHLEKKIRATLGDGIMGYANALGVSVNDTIRYGALSEQIEAARLKRNETVKDAAAAIKAPQYRIRAIESGTFSEIRPEILKRYLSYLGLESVSVTWAQRHPDLAERIGLLPPTP